MKTNKINIILAVVLMMILGCSEDILEEQPPHIITAESLYKNLEGFETGLNGLYSTVRMEREGRSGNNYLRGEMFINGTDIMCTNHRDGFARVAEQWGTRNNPFNNEIESNFIWLYETVNSANTIIGRADNPDVDWTGGNMTAEENRNRVVGEARAVRAWAYRHLTYCWGDVPLSLEESKGSTIKTDWVKTPVGEVRDHMKLDFLFAEKHVPVEPTLPGRISKGAVQTYLAELYLVLNNPDSALFYADKCINTPEYELVTARYGAGAGDPGVPFMDMFKDGKSNREQGNTEALWVFQWEKEVVGGGGSIMRRWHISRYNDISFGGVKPLQLTVERGGRPRARMSMTKFLIDSYEPQDDRFSIHAFRKYYILKTEGQNDPAVADRLPAGMDFGDTIWLDWSEPITNPTRNRVDWPHSRKFEWGDPLDITGGAQYNDQVYLRLADTYLLKAEAHHLRGENEEAATTINYIRQRSNASLIDQADVTIDFILDERGRELFMEEHRRYTLLRTNKWLERTALHNLNGGENIVERDKLFPIPQVVIDANLTAPMDQNPDY